MGELLTHLLFSVPLLSVICSILFCYHLYLWLSQYVCYYIPADTFLSYVISSWASVTACYTCPSIDWLIDRGHRDLYLTEGFKGCSVLLHTLLFNNGWGRDRLNRKIRVRTPVLTEGFKFVRVLRALQKFSQRIYSQELFYIQFNKGTNQTVTTNRFLKLFSEVYNLSGIKPGLNK